MLEGAGKANMLVLHKSRSSFGKLKELLRGRMKLEKMIQGQAVMWLILQSKEVYIQIDSICK